MIFVKPYSSVILVAILIFVVTTALIFGTISVDFLNKEIEGFQAVPLVIDPETKKIVTGYYQVNDTLMALLPYGFKIDPLNPRKIIPFTQTAKYQTKLIVIEDPSKIYPLVPKPGEKMPDGVYLISDSSLAILPPNMMPNLLSIDVTTTNPPKLKYYYAIGYVSETQYYENSFKLPNPVSSLPQEVYYTDDKKKSVSFLQYGQIADSSNGFGAIMNPNINLSSKEFNYIKSNYRDISNNYDVQFHDDLSGIINRNYMYDLEFGETLVLDQTGNLVALPKTNSQGSITYYQPGEFPFGASKYVPNYEDSIYLSSIGYRTRFGNGNAQSSGCGSICQAYNDFKNIMEKQCQK